MGQQVCLYIDAIQQSAGSGGGGRGGGGNIPQVCGHCTEVPARWVLTGTGSSLDGLVIPHIGGCDWRTSVALSCGTADVYSVAVTWDGDHWNVFLDWEVSGFPVDSVLYFVDDGSFNCTAINTLPLQSASPVVGSCTFSNNVTITPDGFINLDSSHSGSSGSSQSHVSSSSQARRSVCLTQTGSGWVGSLDGHTFRIVCEGSSAADYVLYIDGVRIAAQAGATCVPFNVRFVGILNGTPFAFTFANESSCCPPISSSGSASSSHVASPAVSSSAVSSSAAADPCAGFIVVPYVGTCPPCSMQLGVTYGPFSMTPLGGGLFRFNSDPNTTYHVTVVASIGPGNLQIQIKDDCPTGSTLGIGFDCVAGTTSGAPPHPWTYISVGDEAFASYTYTIRVDPGPC